MEIRFTHSFRTELKAIYSYIKFNLGNPKAADDLVMEIKNELEHLSSNPEIGARLSSLFDISLTLRRIIVKNYIIIYNVKDTFIAVDHIYHGSQNYISKLKFED